MPAPTPNPPQILAAIPDIFFGSKVSGAARQTGVAVEFATTREALLARALAGPSLVLVDLDAAGLDAVGAVEDLRALRPTKPFRLVAFARHTAAGKMERARAAGCDAVLTRGAMAETLPRELAALGRPGPDAAVRSRPD